MTVGQLKEKIRHVPDDTPVFLLTDKSAANRDESAQRWKSVYQLNHVGREIIYSTDGQSRDDSLNLILETSTPKIDRL
jgi:hypothetical protein